MKKFLHILFFSASLLTVTGLKAQKNYSIDKSANYSKSGLPTHCYSCTITLGSDVVLTLDSDVQWENATITGGKVIVGKNYKMKFWGNITLANMQFEITDKGYLEFSANMTVQNSSFIFRNTASITVNSNLDLTDTKMTFLDNSSMLVNSGNFNMRGKSGVIIGDGTTTSKAYVNFNGGNLVQYGTSSYISLSNYNNYYSNWSNYNANGKSIKTTDNKLNCSASGKNSCSAAKLYGPATLDFAGIASSAILPVKLTAFDVKLNGNKVNIAWTTAGEINSSRFEIERSNDGLNWKSVGSVKANVNSSSLIAYSFTDASLVSGTVSYRLKMVDQDETFEYSPIRSVKIAGAEGGHEMSIYPNPAVDHVVINAKNATEKMQIQLIGQNGQIVKQMSGNGKLNMPVAEVRAGNYIVRVVDATGNAQSFKLMIVK